MLSFESRKRYVFTVIQRSGATKDPPREGSGFTTGSPEFSGLYQIILGGQLHYGRKRENAKFHT